jgi:hypothetical protein
MRQPFLTVQDLRGDHSRWLLACGSKVRLHSLLPVFRPAGRKTGNKKMLATALPKAKKRRLRKSVTVLKLGTLRPCACRDGRCLAKPFASIQRRHCDLE